MLSLEDIPRLAAEQYAIQDRLTGEAEPDSHIEDRDQPDRILAYQINQRTSEAYQ